MWTNRRGRRSDRQEVEDRKVEDHEKDKQEVEQKNLKEIGLESELAGTRDERMGTARKWSKCKWKWSKWKGK